MGVMVPIIVPQPIAPNINFKSFNVMCFFYQNDLIFFLFYEINSTCEINK
jgi:hypothetical protein